MDEDASLADDGGAAGGAVCATFSGAGVVTTGSGRGADGAGGGVGGPDVPFFPNIAPPNPLGFCLELVQYAG